MSSMVWFDISVANVKRAQKFYGKAFGWKFEKFPEMDYWRISTGGGSLNKGGMGERKGKRPGYLNFIGVPSVARAVAKVKKLGGKIVTPRTPVPGHGAFAVCRDTENNVFALWETKRAG